MMAPAIAALRLSVPPAWGWSRPGRRRRPPLVRGPGLIPTTIASGRRAAPKADARRAPRWPPGGGPARRSSSSFTCAAPARKCPPAAARITLGPRGPPCPAEGKPQAESCGAAQQRPHVARVAHLQATSRYPAGVVRRTGSPSRHRALRVLCGRQAAQQPLFDHHQFCPQARAAAADAASSARAKTAPPAPGLARLVQQVRAFEEGAPQRRPSPGVVQGQGLLHPRVAGRGDAGRLSRWASRGLGHQLAEAFGSRTARSASILRSTSMSAAFKSAMRRE